MAAKKTTNKKTAAKKTAAKKTAAKKTAAKKTAAKKTAAKKTAAKKTAAKKTAAKKAGNRIRSAPSSFDFQLLAQASLDAANACYADCRRRDAEFDAGNLEDQGSFMVITTVFLYFRAIELALKAAIRERGLATIAEIRSRNLGHNLEALIARATSGNQSFALRELGMNQASKTFIVRWSDDYANKWFEYHFVPWDIPNPEQCRDVATAVVEATRAVATTIDPPTL